MRKTLTSKPFKTSAGIFSLIFFFLLATNGHAQVVYVTEWKNDANKKVFVTDNPGEADLIVFKSEWKSDAKKDSGIWYFTEWKNDAQIQIYFTEFRSDADLVICYTDSKIEAGPRK